MTAKHTPGPWTIEDARRTLGAPDFGRAPLRDAETEANARLIAAAPDLLAALRDLLAGMEQHGAEKWMPHRMERARAAIAKAGG